MKSINLALFISIVCISSLASAENKSLSTSGFIPVNYFDEGTTEVKTCDGLKAGFANSYVSIGLHKFTVNKKDSLLKRIFNSNRHAFAVSSLNANFQSQSLSVSRVGKPVLVKGKQSSVDLGVDWGVVERIPWVLKNANLEIKLGYAADSSVNSMIEAFSAVTTAIPDYTISTSLAAGFAVTSAIDNLLFSSGRAVDLLRSERDLPLLAGQLCEGYYAIFAAENNGTYEKYYKSDVVWTGVDLEYKNKPIDDVSYVVVGVKVSPRFYDNVENSLNDTTRVWSSKYSDLKTSFFDLIWVSTKEELDDIQKRIRKDLLEARTLLSSDLNLIHNEKTEIHQFMINEFNSAIQVALVRITPTQEITRLSTANALTKGLNGNNVNWEQESINVAESILVNPELTLPTVSSSFSKEYKKTLSHLNSLIQTQNIEL